MFLRTRLFAFAAAVCIGAPAMAASFTPVAQAREAWADSTLYIGSPDGLVNQTVRRWASAATAETDFGLFDTTSTFSGLSLTTPYGTAAGTGSARQTSSIFGEGIAFAGAVNASTTATAAANGVTRTDARARSLFSYTFVVTTPLEVRLDMDSDSAGQSEYVFGLDLEDGTPIWYETAVDDGNGNLDYSFTRFLLLDPGTYVVGVSLAANGFSGPGGRAMASFALTPVPEPGTWGLLLAGLGVVGLVAARQRV